jgi:hypothetical protein
MRRERLWKVVALVATSMTVGTVMVGTPAGAHVAGWAHNWTEHIRPRTDARYYTKTQANKRYYTKAHVYTKSQSDARFVDENELLWAVVNSNGTLARGSGVSSSQRLATGQYEIRFTGRRVRDCAYTATLGNAGITAQLGFVSAVRRSELADGVFVATWNTASIPTDLPFHLTVSCQSVASPAAEDGAQSVPGAQNSETTGP